MAEKDGFEERLARLERVIERLEEGELPLEKGVELYKEGLGLAVSCRKQLEEARNEVMQYRDGLLAEFDPQTGEDDGPNQG